MCDCYDDRCGICGMNNWGENAPSHADLRVTYRDGTKETFSGVRFRARLNGRDAVEIGSCGTSISVEAVGRDGENRFITILDVRWFEFI